MSFNVLKFQYHQLPVLGPNYENDDDIIDIKVIDYRDIQYSSDIFVKWNLNSDLSFRSTNWRYIKQYIAISLKIFSRGMLMDS